MLGDLLFIGLFIVLPLTLVGWSLHTLRQLRQAPQPSGSSAPPLPPPAEPAPPPRDWAASVQPRRRNAQQLRRDRDAVRDLTRPYQPPAYRGRAGGIVRRLTPQGYPRRFAPPERSADR